ncbi:hypothetical protein [Streptomyces purpurogeneiscleroticus]|uniref:hypothetical protein n=1 Tax=Streptomyces purpurogeneiscleroticus TaxID=68259 RepID=UPI001CBD3018|nr:hypothetical protein [Streptomyces purpurogeneiscleroticus]MBZ4014564.1 hypothetical protein [Streptomyces purpurogeneiscleroticus]
MKQGTVKIIGAAALGAAIAATAAGTASAASVTEPVTGAASGPLQSLTGQAAPSSDDSGKSTTNAKGNLLGGLPAGGVTKAVGGGLPLGG